MLKALSKERNFAFSLGFNGTVTFLVSKKFSSIQCSGAMARKSSRNDQGSKNGTDKERTRGPTSDS